MAGLLAERAGPGGLPRQPEADSGAELRRPLGRRAGDARAGQREQLRIGQQGQDGQTVVHTQPGAAMGRREGGRGEGGKVVVRLRSVSRSLISIFDWIEHWISDVCRIL